jgi:hypothetical protein
MPRKGEDRMSVYKRGKWYWMDDVVNGVRHRRPLKTSSWQQALHLEKEQLLSLTNGRAGTSGSNAQQTFAEAVGNYLEERQLQAAEKTYITDRERSRALSVFFGAMRLRHISPEMVVRYQAERRRHGVSGRTINLEVGLLRRVLKRYKQWARLAEDVRMLRELPKAARGFVPRREIPLG